MEEKLADSVRRRFNDLMQNTTGPCYEEQLQFEWFNVVVELQPNVNLSEMADFTWARIVIGLMKFADCRYTSRLVIFTIENDPMIVVPTVVFEVNCVSKVQLPVSISMNPLE